MQLGLEAGFAFPIHHQDSGNPKVSEVVKTALAVKGPSARVGVLIQGNRLLCTGLGKTANTSLFRA